jgi:hypothetical protein
MFSTFSLFSFYSILKTLFRHKMHVKICARETRDRWPLLTVETEVNGYGYSKKNEIGPFLGWLVGLVQPVREIFVLPMAAHVGPVHNIFFLTVHYLNSFAPIGHQAVQAAVLGRLSLNKCLWSCAKLGQMNCNTCS